MNPPAIASFLLVFGLALGLGLLMTPVSAAIGRRLGLVDMPGPRRMHQRIMPRSGGIGLFVAFAVAVIAIMVLPASWFPPSADANEGRRMMALLVGSAVAFAAGLVDDRLQLSSTPQFIVQLVCALIAIGGLVFIQIVNNPFTGEVIFLPVAVVTGVTIFWFMGMMNTVNFLDGLDGLAGGVTAILCAVLAIHMWQEGQFSVALLPLALLGATLGFLPYNAHPARIVMGSSGAYFLGFALAALGIIAGARVATVLMVMGLPIFDVAWLIGTRLRQGRHPFESGRDHLHHHLLSRGFSVRQIVFGYYAFCAAFGILALLISSHLVKLVAFTILGIIALLILRWAGNGAKPHS